MTKVFVFIIFLIVTCTFSSSLDDNDLHQHPHGHQFRVMNSDDDGKIIVDFKKLDEILLHPDVKDRKIVVVSIVGAFRKGKSFLMDYCLRYMYGNYKSVGFVDNKLDHKIDWIGAEDEPLRGFSWKSGIDRHTTGVMIWSDVFLHDGYNEKLAILLMDTQGLFDTKTSPAENSRIFALGTLLSSKQIFNLNDVIQENQLEYLQLATNYAKFAAEHTDKSIKFRSKPFQQLLFLMRDWTHEDDFSSGLEGGKGYIGRELKITDKQAPELKAVREYITESFDKIDCFLLPFIGTKALKKGYNGRWSEVEPDFKSHMIDLIEWFLKPQNLYPKKIFGVEQTSTTYRDFATSYLEAFQSEEIPKIDSLFETTVNSQLKIYIGESFNSFKLNIAKYETMTSPNSLELLENGMKQSKADAILMFQNVPKLGTEAHYEKYKVKLTNDIDSFYADRKKVALENFDSLVRAELSKKKEISLKYYKKSMKQYEAVTEPDSIRKMEIGHVQAKSTADALFDNGVKWGTQKLEQEYASQLMEEIDTIYGEFKKLPTFIFDALVKLEQGKKKTNSLKYYKREMKTFEGLTSPDYLEKIGTGHEKIRMEAIRQFRSQPNWGNQDDVFTAQLESEIDSEYKDWRSREIARYETFHSNSLERCASSIKSADYYQAQLNLIESVQFISDVLEKVYWSDNGKLKILKFIHKMTIARKQILVAEQMYEKMRSADHLKSFYGLYFNFQVIQKLKVKPGFGSLTEKDRFNVLSDNLESKAQHFVSTIEQLSTCDETVAFSKLDHTTEDTVIEYLPAMVEKSYYIDNLEVFKGIIRCIDRLPSNIHCDGYKSVFKWLQKRKSNPLISVEAYMLAFKDKKDMEHGITRTVTNRNGYTDIYHGMPYVVRAIIYNQNVVMRNIHFDGYMYRGGNSLSGGDEYRGQIFSFRSEGREGGGKGNWRFETTDGENFNIKSLYYGEYLYAETSDHWEDSKHRRIYTWKGGFIDLLDNSTRWNIIPQYNVFQYKDVILLKNVKYGEYLFASEQTRDDVRRFVYIEPYSEMNEITKDQWEIYNL